MSVDVNTILESRFTLDRDGPAPIEWFATDSEGVPEGRASTLICEVTCGDITLTKSVGAGITLEDYLGVTNAFVILQLTSADLADFKLGNFTTYEFREGASDPLRVLLQGEIVIR